MEKNGKEGIGAACGAKPVETGGRVTGKRYGEALKRQVVEEIEAGKLTVAQAQRRHGVAGSQTIRAWQAKYGKAGGGVGRASALTAARAEIARLKREKAELEQALTRQTVKAVTLECAMEEAEARFGEDFKKKIRSASIERARGRLGKEGVRFAMNDVCETLEITRQGHHKALAAEAPKELASEMVTQLVAEHRRFQPRLGGLKLHALIKGDLAAMGIKLGRDRFFDLLREEDLLIERRRSRIKTTNSFHRFRVWSNRLKGLEIERADQAWVADITYLRLRGGFAYLFLLTDVWSRKIVGWALGETLETRWSLDALAMALKGAHAPREGRERIHHSDRGVQYCSADYVNALKREGIEVSMAEAGNPYENAIAERVNGILKDEFLLDRTLEDFETARRAVLEAIHAYNELRPHRSLAMAIPARRYSPPGETEPHQKAA